MSDGWEAWVADKALVMSGMCHVFIRDPDGEVVARVDTVGDDDAARIECERRAALMASAPRLRAALGRVLDFTPAHVPGEKAHMDSYRRRIVLDARALLADE